MSSELGLCLRWVVCATLLWMSAVTTPAAILYVDAASATPTAPYTNWATAARTIQAAIEASSPGDEILVTNGVYRTSGRTFRGNNRVALIKPVIVQSVNGPDVTIIQGLQTLGTNGSGAIRCAYLTNGAMLAGFTLTNGAARVTGDYTEQSGGGAWCESTDAVISNCVFTGNAAYVYGAAVYSGTLKNCILTNNRVALYGAAYSSTLIDCKLVANATRHGAGAYSCFLTNCTLKGNVGSFGGGTRGSTLFDCVLIGNSATDGGGALESVLSRCNLIENVAQTGGGASISTLQSCAITGNSATFAGGTYGCSLTHCTVTGNSAETAGGAAYGSLYNSIAYHNQATSGENHWGATLNYCATTPLPESGLGNIEQEPRLADFAHLSAESPCRGAGYTFYQTTLDIDAEPWAGTPSMGCDEYHLGDIAGPLSVAIKVNNTNLVSGFPASLVGAIDGHATSNRWDFGDGTTTDNRPYVTHAWSAPGEYVVTFWAYNESFPEGVSNTLTLTVMEAPVHYVAAGSTNPVAPYTSWETAARTIQDAVDASSLPGAVILVTNGLYNTGTQTLPAVSGANRVAITKQVTVRSVNGPGVTIIRGVRTNDVNAVRCVYLTNGARLIGFTLTNGGAPWEGGGVWSASSHAVISNCVISGNLAEYGGGANRGVLKNCTLTGNTGRYGAGAQLATLIDCVLSRNTTLPFGSGGGANGGLLIRCLVSENTADYGGGAASAELRNCTITGNSARTGSGGGTYYGKLSNCAVYGNSAAIGGGSFYSALTGCTLTGNTADYGGGWFAESMIANNCIIYHNRAALQGDNYQGTVTLNFSCTTPRPLIGTNNITAEPELADAAHLTAGSPCRAAGNPAFAKDADIDGEAWGIPPSIGCDEVYPGQESGPLSVAITASYTNVAAGFEVQFAAKIVGHSATSQWEFGDGTVVSNRPYAKHAWATPGDYAVVLRAYNSSNPDGVSATLIVRVEQLERYVAASGSVPVAPYLTWATAANNLQSAVNSAPPGAHIVVTNGIYQSSGRTVHGGNRVALIKPLTVRSVNGPEVTTIRGGLTGVPTRGAYVTNGARLIGFTLTNGGTRNSGTYLEQNGGGVLCESTNAIVENCVLMGNTAFLNGGGAFNGTLRNCVISSNRSAQGSGVFEGAAYNCTITGNEALNYGGGASATLVFQSIISGNRAPSGGGMYGGWATNCTLSGNAATNGHGGGANSTELYNCVLEGNSAMMAGGGAYGGSLRNCAVRENSARDGGGVYLEWYNTLNNCTVIGNTARSQGGGMFGGSANNSIIYYNTAWVEPNYSGNLNSCCTTPLPAFGASNIDSEPQLADATHLSPASPCRGAGVGGFSSGFDIDGQRWAARPSIGCDEYYSGSVTGTLSATIQASYTNVAPGIEVKFASQIVGRANWSQWEFQDGTVLENRPYTSQRWDTLGDYTVTLRVFNESNPSGITASVVISVVEPVVHYVDAASQSPAAPYLSWETAARTIQEAIDSSSLPGAIILVNDGVYQVGGTNTNPERVYGPSRVAINKPVVVQSANGAAATIIKGVKGGGSEEMRCAYVADWAALIGFTLSNGAGGVYCESTNALVSKCVIVSNLVMGAFNGTLDDCVLIGNQGAYGGGANGAVLNRCVIKNNVADFGGGAYFSTLNSCTVAGNTARQDGGGVFECIVNNSSLSGNATSSFGTGQVNGRGGGAFGGTLTHCTLTANSAGQGGGSYEGVLNNCIVFYNTALMGANYSGGELNYSCTRPMPVIGSNNITDDPRLADLSHLSATSPCRGAGAATYSRGLDVDGEEWAVPPSMGCDEYKPGGITGELTVGIEVNHTKVAKGFEVTFRASIEGHAAFIRWDFGDGTVINNAPITSHAWTNGGLYSVVLRASNESFPLGVTASVMVEVVDAPIYYVDASSGSPVPPYSSWETAARKIQDAVDAATIPGALVLVTNGVYDQGGRLVASLRGSNRVAVVTPVNVRSVNGPEVTLIGGFRTDADSPVRCVYLTSNASLAGFTLANGGSVSYFNDIAGGGAWCKASSSVLSNCVLVGNAAYQFGGGVYGGTLKNCVVASNYLAYSSGGGGAYAGTLQDCVIMGNVAAGAASSFLERCSVEANSAGLENSTASECLIASHSGLGAYLSVLDRCMLRSNNNAAVSSVLKSCAVIANSSGISFSTANHCTITGNTGTGAFQSTLDNSLVYYNGWANYEFSTFHYSCTTPLPTNGLGNIDTEPHLTDLLHIAADSPCRGAADPETTIGTDINGEPWANPPSIGCDEYSAGPAIGPLGVSIRGDYTNIAAGIEVTFSSVIEGHAHANRWDFGDGTVVSNRLVAAHHWSESGTYAVVFQVFNDTHPGGVSATSVVNVLVNPVHYVNSGNANPVSPFTSWASAATTIQAAVDVAYVGSVVLVTNGVYSAVTASGLVTLRSVNGAAETVIESDNQAPCVYLAGAASLTGFTLRAGGAYIGGGVTCESTNIISQCVLTNNSAEYGGGVYGGILSRCILTGNRARDAGGGAYYSTLIDCTVIGNSAANSGGGVFGGDLLRCSVIENSADNGHGGGVFQANVSNSIIYMNRANNGAAGGAYDAVLNHCTLVSNSAEEAGGALTYTGGLTNCIVYGNEALTGPDNYVGGAPTFCCTFPLPQDGIGNITNAPALVDIAGGNLRLHSNSPCINSGWGQSAGTDLDNNPRMAGGTVDIGAYEFPAPASMISYAWLQRHGLPVDSSTDSSDLDGDRLSNWEEWKAGTAPTDASSALRMINAIPGAGGVIVTWESVPGMTYLLDRSLNLTNTPAFIRVAPAIHAETNRTSYIDAEPPPSNLLLYRVGIAP